MRSPSVKFAAHAAEREVVYVLCKLWNEITAGRELLRLLRNKGCRGCSYDDAFPLFENLANGGHAVAQLYLGDCYHNSEGVDRDRDEANKWYSKAFNGFQKAAEQGNSEAQRYLGVCYRNGKEIAKDYDKAIEWVGKAAAQGNEGARRQLLMLKATQPAPATQTASSANTELITQG